MSDLVVYPNPTSGDLTIHAAQGIEIESAVLLDKFGRLIYTFQDIEGRSLEVDFGALKLPYGMYFLRAQSNSSIFTKRILYLH